MKAVLGTKTYISHVGWYPARNIKGSLDGYTAGGLEIDFGDAFKPKYVVNVMISDGYIGVFDINSSKLKVYSSPGVEATSLTGKTFDMILME